MGHRGPARGRARRRWSTSCARVCGSSRGALAFSLCDDRRLRTAGQPRRIRIPGGGVFGHERRPFRNLAPPRHADADARHRHRGSAGLAGLLVSLAPSATGARAATRIGETRARRRHRLAGRLRDPRVARPRLPGRHRASAVAARGVRGSTSSVASAAGAPGGFASVSLRSSPSGSPAAICSSRSATRPTPTTRDS